VVVPLVFRTAANSSAGDMPAWLSASDIVPVCVAACACGARQTAAAMPARAGTVAAGTTRCLSRDALLWRPKGFLPEQVALTSKAPQGA